MRTSFQRVFIVILSFTVFFVIMAPTAGAFSFPDLIKPFKNLVQKEEVNISFFVTSDIKLAKNGDINENGQIDTGDTVTFTYTLTNATGEEYSFATLKTNINRKQLNFIHNIIGTSSLTDDGKTIEIPNLRIGANQVKTISFDARINYFENVDPTITTEADFVSNDKKSLVKSLKKEIKAKRIVKDKIPGILKQHLRR